MTSSDKKDELLRLVEIWRISMMIKDIPPEQLILLAYMDDEDDDEWIDSFYEMCRDNWYDVKIEKK